jgi:serine protease Do
MKTKNLWLVATLLVALVALSACSTPQYSNVAAAQSGTEAPTAAPVAATAAPVAAAQSLDPASAVADLESTFEQVYAQVNPSVVSIQVVLTSTVSSSVQIPGFSVPQSSQPQEAQGSGFVWDTQGHIVTNNHVVEGATQISVMFSDGTIVPAEITGTNGDSDLAVVKVDVAADALHPVQLADSTQVKVGELAIAIGNPFGLQNTMTQGIISALGRTLPTEANATGGLTYSIPDIIQTDAPINPGNSGGVLVDDTGKVIGVTAAIESSTNSSAGIGFVIPSQIVQKVVPALIETGHYDQPWIGISGTTLVPDLATAMGLQSDQRGILVVDVTSGSPADKAGLQGSTQQVTINGQTALVGGDVIVGVDGQPVKSFEDLIAYLANSTEVGQTITLSVLRNGNETQIDLTLAARPSSSSSAQAETPSTGGAYLGITGVTVTSGIAQAMGLPSSVQGVLVEEVQPGSAADDAGLQGGSQQETINGQQVTIGGDVIIGIDGAPITSFDELSTFLQQAQSGQVVLLELVRNGSLLQVEVTLGEKTASSG